MACAVLFVPSRARAQSAQLAGPLATLERQLHAAAQHGPGKVGIAVEDLATGETLGINAQAAMPAASTIKIPVMVEVFRQLVAGTLDLSRRVHLEDRDRDFGWGRLAYAPDGTAVSVRGLLHAMIDHSDNTASNMLIRLVGRRNINRTMAQLGLHQTRLLSDVRTDTSAVRYDLRSSPHDMLALLDGIARGRLLDPWASRAMLAILAGQQINDLLPESLPRHVEIAHKTGSLHDTLDDVGIVFGDREPYVIAVMTTRLSDLEVGRTFIRRISKIAYAEIVRLGAMRREAGDTPFSVLHPPPQLAIETPDEAMWESHAEAPALLHPLDAVQDRFPTTR
ncbi:MAG: serine hydrolase [Vulcanimicrobiaceae bacterium]